MPSGAKDRTKKTCRNQYIRLFPNPSTHSKASSSFVQIVSDRLGTGPTVTGIKAWIGQQMMEEWER